MTVRRRIPPPRLALGVMEAAESIGMSHDAFKQHVAPELKWVRRGKTKRVAVREIEAWLDRNGERMPAELLGDQGEEPRAGGR